MPLTAPTYEEKINNYFRRNRRANYYIYLDDFLESLGYVKPSRARTRIVNEHFGAGGIVPTIGSFHHRKLLTIDAVRYIFRTCSNPERQEIEPLISIFEEIKV